ncbi:hypothetical protein Glove_395g16 [Diversispora epigaea]|uniref:Uncharacterized protein n=1 Tax=Diversispora epigaea TaxID=1348612 RepID=A0A397H1G5_9GLOM|nr:hypothetical protein Glove_395g16 [Diversispora epigaea]
MQGTYDDQCEMLFIKLSNILTDMIVQCKAALKSKVDITEKDMILAEERDREKIIMRELQKPISQQRRNTGSSSEVIQHSLQHQMDMNAQVIINAPIPAQCEFP